MQREAGGRGRRARRRAPAPRGPRTHVGPWAGWVVFTLLMTGGVLRLVGVSWGTVAWLLVGGAVVGGVLLAAVVLSPPAPLPGATGRPEPPSSGGTDPSAP